MQAPVSSEFIRVELEHELTRLQHLEQEVDSELRSYLTLLSSSSSSSSSTSSASAYTSTSLGLAAGLAGGGGGRGGRQLSSHHHLPLLDSSTSSSSSDINHNVAKLNKLGPRFEVIVEDSKKLFHQIDECKLISEKLNAMVRRLDTIQMRAQEALACTEDVINLKECYSGIQAAIESKNLPLAVRIIKQVHDIDEQAAKASDVYGLLQQAEQEVKQLVKTEFANAIEQSDTHKVLQLSSLLQIIGLENEAQDSFLSFMESKIFIAVSADAAPIDSITDPVTAYAQTLSSIFNSAFLICQQYLPLVIQGMEKSNGDILFIQRLHAKVESEAGNVLKRYMKFRNVKTTWATIKSAVTNNSKLPLSTAEINLTLDEIALLLQYCGSYMKYIKLLCEGAEAKRKDLKHKESDTTHSSIVVFPNPTDFEKMTDELVNKYYLEGEHWLILLGVRAIQAVGFGATEAATLETSGELDSLFFVIQKCSQRAIAIGNIHAACATLHLLCDRLSTDLLSVMSEFIDRSVIEISTSIKDNMKKVLKASGVLAPEPSESVPTAQTSTSFAFGIQNAFQLAAAITSSANAGSTVEKVESKPATEGNMWGLGKSLAVFNYVELCIEYLTSLKREIFTSCKTVFGKAGQDDVESDKRTASLSTLKGSDDMEKIQLCLEDFDSCKASFVQIRRVALDKLSHQIQNITREIFGATFNKAGPLGGIKFDLSHERFENQRLAHMLPKLLVVPFELLVGMCSESLSDNNKNLMVGLIVDSVVSQIEFFVQQNMFSFAGAMKIEECTRSLINIFSQACTVSIRSKFSRLREILLVLTSEAVSASALMQLNSFSYLTDKEITVILGLRVDLQTDSQH